jgi:nucleoside-diphosphate-sugar epimerase
MGLRIFLAGASGVIGRPLVQLLREAGHDVVGTTRSEEGRSALRALGCEPATVDVFDATALEREVAAARPEVVIHQLTSLKGGFDPAVQEQAIRRNARLRREGTANLVRAARAAGARRLIAQSIAWAYAPKALPYREDDLLDVAASGLRAVSVGQGVVPLEQAVLEQAGIDGIVLRYGQLYGPGTWTDTPGGSSPVHVEAAAWACLLAVDRGHHGIYNIADPGGEAASDKAVAELGWRAGFRLDRRD